MGLELFQSRHLGGYVATYFQIFQVIWVESTYLEIFRFLTLLAHHLQWSKWVKIINKWSIPM
jgi:hypothetical protein